MKTTAFVVMLVVEVAVVNGTTPVQAQQLTVCLNSAGKIAIENEATKVTSRVFTDLGVKIQWRGSAQCPTESIHISLSTKTPVNERPGALAYALPYDGEHIVVFFDRIKFIAPSAVSCLLGYTMAHEIAHIIEREVRHSESGIMKANWSEDDQFEISRRHLRFATEDVILIHNGLEWRRSRSPSVSTLSLSHSSTSGR